MLPEAIDRVLGLVSIAVAIPMAGVALWFYLHCVRPSLAVASGRRSAFAIGFCACVALAGTLLIGSFLTIQTLRGERASVQGAYPVVLTAMFASLAIAAIGWSRPTWVVRLTGGADATIPRRYLLDWLSGRWIGAHGDEQRERTAAESFVAAAGDWGIAVGSEADAAIIDFVRGFEHHKRQRQAHRRAVESELRAVAPFDPVSWVRAVRYRRVRPVG